MAKMLITAPCMHTGIGIFLCNCETLKYDSIALWTRIYHIKAALVCNMMAVGMWLCYRFGWWCLCCCRCRWRRHRCFYAAAAAAAPVVNVFTKEIEWRENESREIKRQDKHHTPYNSTAMPMCLYISARHNISFDNNNLCSNNNLI